MILLSNIIKAEYVLYENKSPVEKSEIIRINSSKEELYDTYNQREEILKEATNEASIILDTAKKNAQLEVEAIRIKAYEEAYNEGFVNGKSKGYNEGFQSGFEEIGKELHSDHEIRVNEISEMIKTIENNKQSILSKYENEIPKISLNIAERIMRQKIELKDGSLAKIVESITKDYKNVDWVKIYVSENDEAEMMEADKILINELQRISKDVKVEVKKELKQGSCVVETPNSIVDASVDTQLSNLKEILLNK